MKMEKTMDKIIKIKRKESNLKTRRNKTKT